MGKANVIPKSLKCFHQEDRVAGQLADYFDMLVCRSSLLGKGRAWGQLQGKGNGGIMNLTCEKRLSRKVFSSLVKWMQREDMDSLKKYISN